ncbi:TetR family transcriptional regulator [Nocardioides sp. zg-536]|uniref:TetR family transcriptional regulator n=1 Tax=Nocardioides faecalis TaxID=2803858 RepID=A0A938XY04_9ACTN|nr:TetR/AcrR family transcriptional regulator [Nocardioides faecalis]MBM9458537.1 TetR family transcriptional regulator [Nocardioides faecalis]MBS4752868.1 TetR family transcriptional regulator [Nocardioides faecalis]QVI58540.1 TetR family transcriptional regulator [Nocardioides faecalis]
MARKAARRSQDERRTETRARLLAAAVECLLREGYAATSITAIQERSGAGRGTVQHHFPTKAELMVAATAHVVEQRLAATRAALEQVPADADRIETLVELVWTDLTSDTFLAALELWVAGRTDAELRTALRPHEAGLMSATHELFVAALGDELAADPRAATLVTLTIDALTGIVMTTLLSGGADRLRDTDLPLVLRERWTQALRILLGRAGPETLLDPER